VKGLLTGAATSNASKNRFGAFNLEASSAEKVARVVRFNETELVQIGKLDVENRVRFFEMVVTKSAALETEYMVVFYST
jgi:hypothetical protein